MQAEPLLSRAAAVAGEHRSQVGLNSIVRGLAQRPGVALARIWLAPPGDASDTCIRRPDCLDQCQCLHLVVAVAITNARAFEKIQRAEDALRARAQELQQVIDMVPQHMYILQADGTSPFWNQAAMRFFEPAESLAPKEYFFKYAHPRGRR